MASHDCTNDPLCCCQRGESGGINVLKAMLVGLWFYDGVIPDQSKVSRAMWPDKLHFLRQEAQRRHDLQSPDEPMGDWSSFDRVVTWLRKNPIQSKCCIDTLKEKAKSIQGWQNDEDTCRGFLRRLTREHREHSLKAMLIGLEFFQPLLDLQLKKGSKNYFQNDYLLQEAERRYHSQKLHETALVERPKRNWSQRTLIIWLHQHPVPESCRSYVEEEGCSRFGQGTRQENQPTPKSASSLLRTESFANNALHQQVGSQVAAPAAAANTIVGNISSHGTAATTWAHPPHYTVPFTCNAPISYPGGQGSTTASPFGQNRFGSQGIGMVYSPLYGTVPIYLPARTNNHSDTTNPVGTQQMRAPAASQYIGGGAIPPHGSNMATTLNHAPIFIVPLPSATHNPIYTTPTEQGSPTTAGCAPFGATDFFSQGRTGVDPPLYGTAPMYQPSTVAQTGMHSVTTHSPGNQQVGGSAASQDAPTNANVGNISPMMTSWNGSPNNMVPTNNVPTSYVAAPTTIHESPNAPPFGQNVSSSQGSTTGNFSHYWTPPMHTPSPVAQPGMQSFATHPAGTQQMGAPPAPLTNTSNISSNDSTTSGWNQSLNTTCYPSHHGGSTSPPGSIGSHSWTSSATNNSEDPCDVAMTFL